MVNQLIVHIGDSKTGTTALQHVLRANQSLDTWIYPGDGLNHNDLARALSRPKQARFSEARFRKIFREISAASVPIAILSAEQFQAVRPSQFAWALAKYWDGPRVEIAVAAYCRPHLSKLAAMYSERIKFGQQVGTLDQYARRVAGGERLDFARRYAAWRREFGSDFQPRPYTPGHLDTVHDFFATFLPMCRPPKQSLRANRSLTAEQARLLQTVPLHLDRLGLRHPLPSTIHRLICAKLKASGIASSGHPLRVSQQMAVKLQQRYQDDAVTLDSDIFESDVFEKALFDLADLPNRGALYPIPREEKLWFDTMVTDVLRTWLNSPKASESAARDTLRRVAV